MKQNRTLLLILAITAAGISLDAQGYKKEKLTVEYTSFPSQPLPESVKTYFSVVEPGKIDFSTIEKQPALSYYELTNPDGSTKNNYSSPAQAAEEYMSMRGYERVAEDPDVILKMTFNAFDIKGKKPHKNGTDLIYSYTYGVVFTITDREGNELYRKVYRDPEEVKNYVIGPGGFTKTLEDFLGEYQIELTREHMEKVDGLIKLLFGYTLFYVEHEIYTDKSNRNHNYDDLNQAVEIMQEAFTMITREERKPLEELYQDPSAIEAIHAKLDEAISIWENALKEADFDDKKARVHRNLAPMLYCNIATARIYQKDWEAAALAIEKAMEYKESSDVARFLGSQLERLKKRYSLHGII